MPGGCVSSATRMHRRWTAPWRAIASFNWRKARSSKGSRLVKTKIYSHAARSSRNLSRRYPRRRRSLLRATSSEAPLRLMKPCVSKPDARSFVKYSSSAPLSQWQAPPPRAQPAGRPARPRRSSWGPAGGIPPRAARPSFAHSGRLAGILAHQKSQEETRFQ